MEWAIKNIQFHNEKRLHTHPLEHDDQLTEQAFMTAEALAREGRLYHRDVPEGGMQNIAQGYGNWVDKPNKCIELWMQDYNHSFPITSASFSKVGVGYCQNPSTKKVYVVANYK